MTVRHLSSRLEIDASPDYRARVLIERINKTQLVATVSYPGEPSDRAVALPRHNLTGTVVADRVDFARNILHTASNRLDDLDADVAHPVISSLIDVIESYID